MLSPLLLLLFVLDFPQSHESDFESSLDVHGEVMHGRYRVLTVESASVPNALAALLLARRGAGEPAIEAARIVLAAIAVFVAGAPLGRKAVRLIVRGILSRELLAGAAALLCFTSATAATLLSRTTPPGWPHWRAAT